MDERTGTEIKGTKSSAESLKKGIRQISAEGGEKTRMTHLQPVACTMWRDANPYLQGQGMDGLTNEYVKFNYGCEKVRVDAICNYCCCCFEIHIQLSAVVLGVCAGVSYFIVAISKTVFAVEVPLTKVILHGPISSFSYAIPSSRMPSCSRLSSHHR